MNTINKAEAIRELFAELGIDISSKELIQRLQTQGIEVSPQQVSNEKARIKRKSRAVVQVDDLPVSVLKKVKALVDELGGAEVVKRALEELKTLN